MTTILHTPGLTAGAKIATGGSIIRSGGLLSNLDSCASRVQFRIEWEKEIGTSANPVSAQQSPFTDVPRAPKGAMESLLKVVKNDILAKRKILQI
jgi:hypothetical protein